MPEEQNLEAQQQDGNQQERPEWLPDNFKTPEDLVKSYGELRAEFNQTKQSLHAQQDQLEQFIAQQEEKDRGQDGDFLQQSQDQIYAAYEQNPVETMAWLAKNAAEAAIAQQAKNNQPDRALQQTQAELAGEYAERQVTVRYSDWPEYREQVAAEITANPDLYPEEIFQTPSGIEKALVRAYQTVRFGAAEKTAETTGATLEQQLASQRLAKQQAQTLSGAAGRPTPTDSWEDRWEEIQNAPNTRYRDIAGGK